MIAMSGRAEGTIPVLVNKVMVEKEPVESYSFHEQLLELLLRIGGLYGECGPDGF